MTDPSGTIVDTVGRCMAIWDEDGKASAQCTPATPRAEEDD
jgi:hypothetical protein